MTPAERQQRRRKRLVAEKVKAKHAPSPRASWDEWGNEADSSREAAPGDAPKGARLDWLEQDAVGSYHLAIAEIGRRVRAGEPVPECLLPKRDGGSEP